VTVPLVEARALAVTPPGASEPVVRGVDFTLGAGEWVALTGANGSGKSSLALALAGLWPVAAGEVRWPGVSRRDIAVVLQEPASQLLQPSVRDEIAFAARNLEIAGGLIEGRIAGLADELELAGDLERDPRTLSAGRQQLVLLAAALAAGPRVLIADEPGAHLDHRARELALAAVGRRVAVGLAVLWITQDETERSRAGRQWRMPGTRDARPSARPDALSSPAPRALPSAGSSSIEVDIGPPPADGPAVRMPGLRGFAIADRGLHALTGPNGCGKSVLIAAIAGLRPLAQVRIRGALPAGPPPIVATQYPEMEIFEERVRDELQYAAVQRGIPRQEVQATILEWLADLVPDPEQFLGRRCFSLSAGEKRLVSLLAALLAPASLVLLDEPTAGLDKELRAALGRRVVRRAAQTPVLVATQDSGWAAGAGAVLLRAHPEPANSPSRR
jgi:energy-coupling factor transporter ATP-binding protein EcfA2